MAVLSRILVGPDDYDYHFYSGELRLSGASPVLYPPDADGCGYTYWHRCVDLAVLLPFACTFV